MIKNQKLLLLVMMLGLAGLLCARDVLGIELSKYIFVVYIVFFLAISDYKTMIKMLCFVFPLVCGLPGTYIMLCALVLLIIKKGSMNLWQTGLILFVAAMELFASIWYSEFDIASIAQYILFAGVMFFLLHDNTELNYVDCVKSFFFGICVLCTIILITGIMSAPDNWLSLFANGKFRFGETHTKEAEGMMISLNANSLAYYSVVGVMCGIFLLEMKIKVNKILMLALVLLIASTGFLTVSRSWLLVMFICIALYIASKIRHMKGLMVTFMALCILLIIGFVCLKEYPELLEGFLTRLTADDIEGGNGRTEIFVAYMDVFWSDVRFVLLGTGVTDYIGITGELGSMHNGTQQILVCCGLVGFVVWMNGLIVPIFRTRFKKTKTSFWAWLPMIGIVLFVQTIQFLNPMMLMLPFVVALYSIKAEKNPIEKSIDWWFSDFQKL